MSDRATLERAGWLLTAADGKLLIQRNEHADWLEIDAADIPSLAMDIDSLRRWLNGEQLCCSVEAAATISGAPSEQER